VGDWDCDAVATPAVLRPGTGELWRYPRWAGPDEEVTAILTTTVPGAVAATVEPAPASTAGCDAITVLDAAGALTRVEPTVSSRRSASG
jgi:hypothetical protein